MTARCGAGATTTTTRSAATRPVTRSPRPFQVGTATNWATVSAGERHTLATRTDGTLWGWGNDIEGAVGNGASGMDLFVPSPVQVGTATNWTSVAAADSRSFGIRTDGTLWAWGDNVDGGLGLGGTTSPSVPTRVGTATNWASVSSASRHALGDALRWHAVRVGRQRERAARPG